MKVVLISCPTFLQPGNHKPAASLALAVLSSILKNQNIECECIDCNFLPSFCITKSGHRYDEAIYNMEFGQQIINECVDNLARCNPDIVGISTWGTSIPFAIVLAQAIDKNLPNIPIVAGGIRDSFLATMFMKHAKQVSAIAIGDGETIILEIVDRISTGRNFVGIKGTAHREYEKICCEPSAPPLPVHSWGKPDYSSFLFPLSTSYRVEGSRGCSYKCSFCVLNNVPLRRKAPQTLAHEIIKLKEKTDHNIIFLADNFIPLRGEWINKFCDTLLSLEPKVKWTCCSRADNASYSTIQKMARAGCNHIFLGVESVSSNTLAYINKASSISKYLSDIMDTLHAIKDNGIKLRVSTIIGFPYEKIEDMQRTIEFVLHLQNAKIFAYTGPVVVYPGSHLWTMYEKGQIELQKIANPEIRRNSGGLFSARFAHIPYIVPNNFLPKHKFLKQEELESIITKSLKLTHRADISQISKNRIEQQVSA